MSRQGQYIVEYDEGSKEWVSEQLTELIEGGLPSEAKVEILNRASESGGICETLSLEAIRRRLMRGEIEGSGILLINAPRSLFLNRVGTNTSPLEGKRIVVTRTGEQATEL